MMRVILACALLLCVLGVEASSLRDSILSESHRCCASSCTSQEKEKLEREVQAYELEGVQGAQDVRQYKELAVAKEVCSSGHNKRAAPNNVTATCPYGPFDVSTGDVTISITASFNLSCGIYYASVYASIYVNGQSYTIYPQGQYYYYDSGQNATSMFRSFTLIIPQYAAYGNWTLQSYAYCSGYTSYTYGSAIFNVTKNINDVSPPVLVSVNASVWNANDNDRSISFSATDDLVGVRSIEIYVINATSGSTVAYGTYYTAYINGKYVGIRVLASAITNLYNYTYLSVGVYNITVYLYDVMGAYVYLSTQQLSAMRLQSQIIVAVGTCNAGRKLAYGATGSCTLCDKGTFSGPGAFRCKACLPGTASNVAGATQCTTCPPGTAGIGGSAGCDICPAGTQASSWGNAECQPCYPGSNSTDGSEYCNSCPAGTYSLGGSAQCTPCPAGTSSGGGNFACDPCQPGTYMPNTGAYTCLLCPAGTYSWVGFTTPTPCPSPTVNGPPGSNSRLNCY